MKSRSQLIGNRIKPMHEKTHFAGRIDSKRSRKNADLMLENAKIIKNELKYSSLEEDVEDLTTAD